MKILLGTTGSECGLKNDSQYVSVAHASRRGVESRNNGIFPFAKAASLITVLGRPRCSANLDGRNQPVPAVIVRAGITCRRKLAA